VVNTKVRPLIIALASAIAVQGCATVPGQKSGSIAESFKQTFNNDDPCANSKRNIGLALGAIAGAIVGSQVAGNKNKLAGVLIGTATGAGIGGFIGSEVDKRQCEISKIQKKYNADIQVTAISTRAPLNQNSQSTSASDNKTVGLSVNVVDQKGEPQFASGSDDLNPKSSEMFMEIANQYKLPTGTDEASKNAAELLKARRVLLIGHTDDTGSTNLNAELSEHRARNVAKVFKSAGVPEAQIFYQGAGETLPFADNATEEGRAINRRVEIVDLSDEDTFKLYLQNRRANTEYYRPAEATTTNSTQPAEKPQINKREKTAIAAKKADKKTMAKESIAAKDSTATKIKETARSWIDFGGSPATSENTAVNIGEAVKVKPTFTLIGTAQASDMRKISSCNMDRPRDSGGVKSLKDGKEYTTSEYLPGVYNSSWAGQANGHLIALTHVAVLRDGNAPARKPNLLIYQDYKSGSNAKPTHTASPEVNVYRGDQAVLYRVFDNGPVQCMDVVIPNSNPKEAPNSMIYYNRGDTLYSASFNPKLAK